MDSTDGLEYDHIEITNESDDFDEVSLDETDKTEMEKKPKDQEEFKPSPQSNTTPQSSYTTININSSRNTPSPTFTKANTIFKNLENSFIKDFTNMIDIQGAQKIFNFMVFRYSNK